MNVFRMPEVNEYAKEFQRRHWSFLGPGDEEKWCGMCYYKPEGTSKPII